MNLKIVEGWSRDMATEIYPGAFQKGVFVEALTRGFYATKVLDQFSCVCEPGQVYVLLGAAGSGKSTLVRCVTGELVPEKGRATVAGHSTASDAYHAVLGYMPQQLGLFADLTVMENMLYFGRLSHMRTVEIEEAYEELRHKLQLPEPHEVVGSLGRGSQQMVSFAVAVQHRPRVLVLDEPNMGLDLLRNQHVWDLLLHRAHAENVAVLVTSHNVDDTKHADRVGFMRAGRLLAEGTPASLCEQYGCDNLEDVFRNLCLQDDQSFLPIVRKMRASAVRSEEFDFREVEAVSSSVDDDHSGNEGSDGEFDDTRRSGREESFALLPTASEEWQSGARKGPAETSAVYEARSKSSWRNCRHIRAVLLRQLHSLRRSWFLLLCQVLVPTLQALVFLLFVGNAPQYLPVAVVNHDVGPAGSELAFLINVTDALETQFYDTASEALSTVEQANGVLAVFVIPENFTVKLNQLMTNPAKYGHNFTLVDLYLDYGDYQVTTVVEKKLESSIQTLLLK